MSRRQSIRWFDLSCLDQRHRQHPLCNTTVRIPRHRSTQLWRKICFHRSILSRTTIALHARRRSRRINRDFSVLISIGSTNVSSRLIFMFNHSTFTSKIDIFIFYSKHSVNSCPWIYRCRVIAKNANNRSRPSRINWWTLRSFVNPCLSARSISLSVCMPRWRSTLVAINCRCSSINSKGIISIPRTNNWWHWLLDIISFRCWLDHQCC